MKMNKIVPLLLVTCMMISLVACGTEANQKKSSDESSQATSTEISSSSQSESGSEAKGEEPISFAGTEIQVWGVDAGWGSDVTTIDSRNSTHLVIVAMMEWAAENDVTLTFEGGWNQSRITAALAAGKNPELLLVSGQFPKLTCFGWTAPLTEEGVAVMAQTVGASYLEAASYQGKSHGVLLPVNETYMCFYNKTLFEQYGVKTPKEYWLEGNWNWDIFEEVAKLVTKDVDSDGKNDTYGMASDFLFRMTDYYEENADGSVTSTTDTDQFKRYADIFYNGIVEGYIVNGKASITTTVNNPRPVMQFLDCETWNMDEFYWELENGDCLEVVPIPVMDENDDFENNRDTYAMYKFAANDNVAATEAMMNYVLECNMKYMSDVSLGIIPCEYEGLKGTCPASAQFLSGHATRLEEDKAKLSLPHYDKDYVAKVNEYLNSCPCDTYRAYSGVNNPGLGTGNYKALMQEEPESSLPKIIEKHKSECDAYNKVYAW